MEGAMHEYQQKVPTHPHHEPQKQEQSYYGSTPSGKPTIAIKLPSYLKK